MPWAKVDDNFPDHPKIVRLLDEPDGLTAVGLWTICLAWARKQHKRGQTEALIPHGVPRRLTGCDPTLPALLVKVGLWIECADGWMIHDYKDYLPSAAMSNSRSEAGRLGGIKSGQSRVSAGERSKLLQEGSMGFEANEATAKHAGGVGTGSSKDIEVVGTSLVAAERDDVERLCAHLADWVERNGSKRPVITQGWRDSCRRMIDIDGRTEEQARKAIDWASQDAFWCDKVMSMDKLRKQYDRLRLAASRNGSRPATTDARVQAALDLLGPDV